MYAYKGIFGISVFVLALTSVSSYPFPDPANTIGDPHGIIESTHLPPGTHQTMIIDSIPIHRPNGNRSNNIKAEEDESDENGAMMLPNTEEMPVRGSKISKTKKQVESITKGPPNDFKSFNNSTSPGFVNYCGGFNEIECYSACASDMWEKYWCSYQHCWCFA